MTPNIRNGWSCSIIWPQVGKITALQEETAVHIHIFDSFLGGRLYYKIFRKAYGAAGGSDMAADIDEKSLLGTMKKLAQHVPKWQKPAMMS